MRKHHHKAPITIAIEGVAPYWLYSMGSTSSFLHTCRGSACDQQEVGPVGHPMASPSPIATSQLLLFSLFFLFFSLFLFFLGALLQHMEVLRLGSNQSCSCQSMPQPQPCAIQAAFVNYTTAHTLDPQLTE